jgi:hypothetical protein
LGEHRIGCGDSTSAADVNLVLAGSEPHLMVTEPPFDDERVDWRQAYALFPGDTAYVWCGALHGDVVSAGLAACGFQLRAQIVWIKHHFTRSNGDYRLKHEVCWYSVRDGKTSHWHGDHKQTTVWEIAENKAFGNRRRQKGSEPPSSKPIECMRCPIVNNSGPGEAIWGAHCLSGTPTDQSL